MKKRLTPSILAVAVALVTLFIILFTNGENAERIDRIAIVVVAAIICVAIAIFMFFVTIVESKKAAAARRANSAEVDKSAGVITEKDVLDAINIALMHAGFVLIFLATYFVVRRWEYLVLMSIFGLNAILFLWTFFKRKKRLNAQQSAPPAEETPSATPEDVQ
jgi:protein-S-isoprenylcysteine O-methyltransferase Ste14